jgi:hypothetical protein
MARTDFLNRADELNYVSDMVRYVASRKQLNSEVAVRFLEKFERLLKESGKDDGSIILQDHWSLFHEVRGDYRKAIPHREREIALIEQLFEIGGPVGPINKDFLSKTIQTLAQDYLAEGEQDKAHEVLRACEKNENGKGGEGERG